ncbi:cingulin-like [Diaphorina citri]|uniref:Cingulin-like n=1 Tax=Diaphorina citri TaxID=121845 RepID=A0A3Q0JG83_DIACI|nr:cingulin-like [Diaphorina citri]
MILKFIYDLYAIYTRKDPSPGDDVTSPEDLNYIHVDLSEGTLVSIIMITSLVTVAIHCLTTLNVHVHKSRQFRDKLMAINARLNFDLTRLKNTYSMLIDKYFLSNALRSVEQLLVTNEDLRSNLQDKDGSRTLSMDQLRSQIQVIKSRSENLSELDLVQKVSDLCLYVESFHLLNINDEIPDTSNPTREGSLQIESSYNSVHAFSSKTNVSIEYNNNGTFDNGREALLVDHTKVKNTIGSNKTRIKSGVSQRKAGEAEHSNQHINGQRKSNDVLENGESFESKPSTCQRRNTCVRKIRSQDSSEGDMNERMTNIETNNPTDHDEEQTEIEIENHIIDNGKTSKTKVCLKKPYNTKKLKFKKLAANSKNDMGKEKNVEERKSLTMKGSYKFDALKHEEITNADKTKESKKKKETVKTVLDKGSSKNIVIKKKLSKLITVQTRDSIRSLANTVRESHENIFANENTELDETLQTPERDEAVDAEHSANTSEFKIKSNASDNQRKPGKWQDNGVPVMKKKSTNIEIKKKLERGYHKLRKASENKRYVDTF